MLWIVSGPSSAGKSSFIGHRRSYDITGLGPDAAVVFPKDHQRISISETSSCFFHYNVLRCVHILHNDVIRKQSPNLLEHATPAYGEDPVWRYLSERPGEKRAIVLVASRETLLHRVRQRRIFERGALKRRAQGSYPAREWEFVIGHINLREFYQQWLNELIAHGIPYLLLDSTNSCYRTMNESEASELLSGSDEPVYTKSHLEELLREQPFDYQRVEVPYGLSTEGSDRSDTRDAIFSASFEGKSVLDVGSALGYFCFEAEARGAAKVVGYEPMAERYEQANLLKKIKQSKVEFVKADITQSPPSDQFDYVLLLNVLHHLKEPVRAIRLLASIARERLIIEFPTLEDAKFRSTTRMVFPSLLNRLPLIGVSSLSGADQTFVFTEEAIKRIVSDHDSLIKEIEFVRSPLKGRAIAICRK